MYDAKTAILLKYTEPAQPVQQVRQFIDTCTDLRFDNAANFFVDAWWNWNVMLNPRLVCDRQYFDRWKEVRSKVYSF
jgi:hypothetical protein